MKDPLQTMAQIVKRAGDHGTGDLKEDEAGPRINVGLRRTFKRDSTTAICRALSNKRQERRTRGETVASRSSLGREFTFTW